MNIFETTSTHGMASVAIRTQEAILIRYAKVMVIQMFGYDNKNCSIIK